MVSWFCCRKSVAVADSIVSIHHGADRVRKILLPDGTTSILILPPRKSSKSSIFGSTTTESKIIRTSLPRITTNGEACTKEIQQKSLEGRVQTRAPTDVQNPTQVTYVSLPTSEEGCQSTTFLPLPPSMISSEDKEHIDLFKKRLKVDPDVAKAPLAQEASFESLVHSSRARTPSNSKARLPTTTHCPRSQMRPRTSSLSFQNSPLDKLPELNLGKEYISTQSMQSPKEEPKPLHRSQTATSLNRERIRLPSRSNSRSLSRDSRDLHRSSSSDSLSSARFNGSQSARKRKSDLVIFLRPFATIGQADYLYADEPQTFTSLLLGDALKSKCFANGFFGQEYNYELAVDCDHIADLLCSDQNLLRSFFSLKVSVDMAKELLEWSPDFIDGSFSSSVQFSSHFFEAIKCLHEQKLVSVHGKSWAWMNLITLPPECLSLIQCLDCSGQHIFELPYRELFNKFPSLQILNLNHNEMDIPLPDELDEAHELHFVSLFGVPMHPNERIGKYWHSMWSLYEEAEKHWPEKLSTQLEEEKEKILSHRAQLERIYVNTTWLNEYRNELQSTGEFSSLHRDLSSLLLCFKTLQEYEVVIKT